MPSSAGIVPYFLNNRGEILFLLGREAYSPGWYESDRWGVFGGKLENGEDFASCAARECYEETAGCIMSLANWKQVIEEKKYRLCMKVKTAKGGVFHCFFIQVPFSNYPELFFKIKAFVQYTKGNVDCIEKNKLKWFSNHELFTEINNCPNAPSATYGMKPVFRKKFRSIMQMIWQDKKTLETVLRQRFSNNNNTFAPIAAVDVEFEELKK